MLTRINSHHASAMAGEMLIDECGWCVQARHVLSPNFGERPVGMPIDLLVIHNISLPSGEFGGEYIVDLFQNQLDVEAHPSFDDLRGVQVSSHFLIRRDGELLQFVSCLARAWHAGRSHFQGRDGCNDFSIGIELEGCDTCAFTEAQYLRLAGLSSSLAQHYPLRAIVGHQDIAPGRKTDPGPHFDWQQYQQLMPNWTEVGGTP